MRPVRGLLWVRHLANGSVGVRYCEGLDLDVVCNRTFLVLIYLSQYLQSQCPGGEKLT
jgi:hypothetical protein